MPLKEVTPQEAHDLLEKAAGCVYIDVRTVSEFCAGHPEGAVNVPVVFPEPGRGMVPNDEFVSVVEAQFPKDQKIIVGCQAGPRSEMAARLLERAGYHDVSNMVGGFGGMRDPFGRVIAPGWSSLGLPVSQDNGPGVSYDSLRAKVQGKM